MKWLTKSFVCLICLVAIVPFIEAKRRQEEVPSNIRQQQQQQTEASNQQQMTPELIEFKDELIAALEIPQAVQILYDLFAFLSTPLDISIDAAEALVEATNTKQQNNPNVKETDEDATGGVRQLGEVVDAAELTAPLEFPPLDVESMPLTGFVDSVLSMAELLEISRITPDSGESEQMEDDTVAARVRHLQALNDIRMRAGEVVGDVLYGKQPTITKLLTPQRGPVETVLYGRSPLPRGRRRGIL